ncbi:DUF1573 domain-containing protein [bacterium]|nr:MAG: DUF1573 domain-containing protein [bacterium]
MLSRTISPRSNRWLFASLTFFTTSTLSLPTCQAQQTLPGKPQLVDAKGKKTENNDAIVYDFGKVSQLDPKWRSADMLKRIKFEHVLPGIKHVFTLKNAGKTALTISDIRGESINIQAEVVKNNQVKDVPFPYKVKPGENVAINVAFDPYIALPGTTQAKVELFQPNSRIPIATLIMKGEVHSGIRFIEKELDFGTLPSTSTERFKDFSLVLDPRVPEQYLPGPLKLICQNPHITIENLDKPENLMGTTWKDNFITFPLGEFMHESTAYPEEKVYAASKPFPHELQLHFRAVLSDSAPLGNIVGRIAVVVAGAPYAIIARNAIIPIKGELK